MAENFNVTGVGQNPGDDRAHRMRFYFISMTLRFLCVASLLWVRGWWVFLPIIGAVVLPYLAVMIGNAAANLNDSAGPEKIAPQQLTAAQTQSPQQKVIVVDAPASRYSSGERINEDEISPDFPPDVTKEPQTPNEQPASQQSASQDHFHEF